MTEGKGEERSLDFARDDRGGRGMTEGERKRGPSTARQKSADAPVGMTEGEEGSTAARIGGSERGKDSANRIAF